MADRRWRGARLQGLDKPVFARQRGAGPFVQNRKHLTTDSVKHISRKARRDARVEHEDPLSMLRQALAVDLLFSDISLPGGISGTALAREAKKLRPGLKVLLTSGLAVSTATEEAERDGVEFIGKPYRRTELASKVQSVLNQ